MSIFDDPFTGAISSGLTIGGVIGLVGYGVGYGIGQLSGNTPRECGILGMVAGGGSAVLFFQVYFAIRAYAVSEYWKYKRIRAEQEPPKEEPPAGFQKLTLQVDADNVQFFRLRADARQLAALTKGLANDRSLAVRRWTVGRGSPFSQGQFKILIEDMVKQKLAAQVGNTVVLTELGAQALERGVVVPLSGIA